MSDQDPLRQLLNADELGEVKGWGAGPHITICDALTSSNPERFDEVIRVCCGALQAPKIEPRDLKIFKGIALVVRIQSPALEEIKVKVQEATHPYIVRYPIADEEWQRAAWWIREKDGEVAKNLEVLKTAREIYESAGTTAEFSPF